MTLRPPTINDIGENQHRCKIVADSFCSDADEIKSVPL
jgi:hypothetical protein